MYFGILQDRDVAASHSMGGVVQQTSIDKVKAKKNNPTTNIQEEAV